jgi:serine/threonine-protein kinase
VTAATDVYALGVVAYQCLTGTVPFVAATTVEVAIMQVNEDPPPLPESLPEGVRQVVERALTKDPEKRWASAADMAEAAREAGDTWGSGTAPRILGQRETSLAQIVAAPQTIVPRRRQVAVIAIMVAVVVVIALVAVYQLAKVATLASGPEPTRPAVAAPLDDPSSAQPPVDGGPAPGGPTSTAPASRATGRASRAATPPSGPGVVPPVPPPGSPSPAPVSSTSIPPFSTVPEVRKLYETDARQAIANAALVADVHYKPNTECVVLSQSPAGGKVVPRGSKVTITIGKPTGQCIASTGGFV